MFHLQNRLKAQQVSRVTQTAAPRLAPLPEKPVQPKMNPVRIGPLPTPPVSGRRLTITTESKKQKILLYILCQDSHSEKQAVDRFRKQTWAHILRLDPDWQHSGLQENCMQLQYLPEHEDEWKDQDFVGTISQKAPQKIDLTRLINTMELGTVGPKQQQLEDFDAIFFFCSKMSFESSVRGHPNFMKIWTDSIQNQCMITSKETAFCNFWMARPCCMINQIHYFKDKIWLQVSRHPLAMTDAKQKSTHSKESIQKCNGRPQYTHVPFILERVPRNFFKDFGYLYTCL